VGVGEPFVIARYGRLNVRFDMLRAQRGCDSARLVFRGKIQEDVQVMWTREIRAALRS
jgi:hypothetical protein